MQVIVKSCDCKGKRTCLVCEGLFNRKARDWFAEFKNLDSHVYCLDCQKIFKGWQVISSCDQHGDEVGKEFSGFYIQKNFLSEEESQAIVDSLDVWDLSQSGRRKRNFGPKVNFKKKKIRTEFFNGFFESTKLLRERINRDVKILEDFKIIEECFLEYDQQRGSHIEPHIDDCWIWGERVVTVNCIGETVLTLTKHFPTYAQQYNIDCLEEYKDELLGQLEELVPDDIVVRILLPANSLCVLYGAARYQYEHSVLREDVNTRRVCIAYREFTKMYAHLNDQFL